MASIGKVPYEDNSEDKIDNLKEEYYNANMIKEIKVGQYNKDYNQLLGLDLDEYEIIRSSGLPSHLIKREHWSALKYIDYIPNILSDPDYIGFSNANQELSVEYVKKLGKNMFLAVKVDSSKGHMYVSTMFEISDSKINKYLSTGRLKKIC